MSSTWSRPKRTGAAALQLQLQRSVQVRPQDYPGGFAAVCQLSDSSVQWRFSCVTGLAGIFVEHGQPGQWEGRVRVPLLRAWREPKPDSYGALVRYLRVFFADHMVVSRP